MRFLQASAAFTVMALLLFSACGPQENGTIAVKAFHGLTRSQALSSDPPPEGDPPPGISDYRLCVSATGAQTACSQFSVERNPAGAAMKVGVGKNLKLTFQGFNETHQVLWCGEAGGITVLKDKVVQVKIFLTQCSSTTRVRNNPSTARFLHTVTQIDGGNVLVIGGFSTFNGTTAAATGGIEFYNSAEGRFSPMDTLSLHYPRGGHTAHRISTNLILVAGGCANLSFSLGSPAEIIPENCGQESITAELIDIAGQTVTDVPMSEARSLHAGLADDKGNVFLLGGVDSGGNCLASLDMFDPATGTFAPQAVMLSAGRMLPAVAVDVSPDGRISGVIWGGLRPPAAGAFAEAFSFSGGEIEMNAASYLSTAPVSPTLFSAGSPLGAGRLAFTGGIEASEAEVRTPAPIKRTWFVDTGVGKVNLLPDNRSMMFPRAGHSLTALRDGRILAAGGVSVAPAGMEPKVEIYSAEEDKFSQIQISGSAVELTESRALHSATVLDDGTVLLCGGMNSMGVVDSAEVFNPLPTKLWIP